jgi:hypothetical protein
VVGCCYNQRLTDRGTDEGEGGGDCNRFNSRFFIHLLWFSYCYDDVGLEVRRDEPATSDRRVNSCFACSAVTSSEGRVRPSSLDLNDSLERGEGE